MLLIFHDSSDHSRRVSNELDKRSIDHFNLMMSGLDLEAIEIKFDTFGDSLSVTDHASGLAYDGPITGYYLPSIDLSMTPTSDMAEGDKKWATRQTASNLFQVLETLPATKINSPSAIANARHKWAHLSLARAAGLRIPHTLISNSPNGVRDFIDQRRDVIFKAVDDNRQLLDGKRIYTNRISHADTRNERALRIVLSMFQEHVEKDFEVRAFTIGEQVLSCAIDSQSSELSQVDWRRYDIASTKYEAFKLPDPVEQKLLRISRHFNLGYAAYDLIKGPDAEYTFLEVNPDGAYGWIEDLTELPITSLIVDQLVAGL